MNMLLQKAEESNPSPSKGDIMKVLLVNFFPLNTFAGGGPTYIHALSHGLADLNVKVSVLGLKDYRPNTQTVYTYDSKVNFFTAGHFSNSNIKVLLGLPNFVITYLYLAKHSDLVQTHGIIDCFLAKCLTPLTRNQKIVYFVGGDLEAIIKYQRADQPLLRALFLLIWKIGMWRSRYIITSPSLAREKGWIGINVPVGVR